jgi:hypothetical protein
MSSVVEERDGHKMVRIHVTWAERWQETGATSPPVTCDRAHVIGDMLATEKFICLLLYRVSPTVSQTWSKDLNHTIVPVLLPDQSSYRSNPSG